MCKFITIAYLIITLFASVKVYHDVVYLFIKNNKGRIKNKHLLFFMIFAVIPSIASGCFWILWLNYKDLNPKIKNDEIQ
jgi:heme/copper-type cytochrome/quinol oxidase subunit 4